MSLVAAIAQIRAALAPLLPDAMIPDAPPNQLGGSPMFVIYPQPGDSAWDAHDRSGKAIYRSDDVVVIEYHLKQSDLARATLAATPMVDAVRKALMTEFKETRFHDTIDQLSGVRFQHFGEMQWGSDKTFGFALLVDVTTRDLTD